MRKPCPLPTPKWWQLVIIEIGIPLVACNFVGMIASRPLLGEWFGLVGPATLVGLIFGSIAHWSFEHYHENYCDCWDRFQR